MVVVNRVETPSHNPVECKPPAVIATRVTTEPYLSDNRAMPRSSSSGYGSDVWSVQIYGQIAHRTTTCRCYSEDPNSDRTSTVQSAVRASDSTGSLLLPPNAPPCAPSFSASYETITLPSRAAR